VAVIFARLKAGASPNRADLGWRSPL